MAKSHKKQVKLLVIEVWFNDHTEETFEPKELGLNGNCTFADVAEFFKRFTIIHDKIVNDWGLKIIHPEA